MTDRVVNFADMAFKLRGKSYGLDERCQHTKVTLDDEGGVVTCDACHRQLDPYLTLRRMCEKWEEHAQQVKSAAQRVNEDAKAIVVLRAAKRIERAWRSRTMIPTCPHCHVAILPEDGFGSCTTNREIELRRRQAKRQQLSESDGLD